MPKKSKKKSVDQIKEAISKIERSNLPLNKAISTYCPGWSEKDKTKVLDCVEIDCT